MKSLNLKLFTLAMAAVLPAFTNTLTSVSDSTGVHINFTAPPYQGGDAAQQTVTLNGSITSSGYFNGDVSLGSNLASFSDVNGEHVFFIGRDFNVYEVLYPPNPPTLFTPSITNLTQGNYPALANSGRIVTTGLTACSGSAGNFVFYVDMQGHLIELSSGNGTPWNIGDLTASFGGPAVSQGSNLVSFCSGIWGQQVFYIDTNYNVNAFSVVWQCRLLGNRPSCGPGWQNSNLTANTAGAPTTFAPPDPSISSLALTGFQDSFGTHIFYVASNQNINQLWFQTSGTWSNQNVMPSVPCFFGRCSPPPPLPAVSTALSSLADPQGNQHVFYIDANRGISELSHAPNLTTLGNGWSYGSPTTSAGISLQYNPFGGNLQYHPVDSGCSMMQLTSLVDSAGGQRVYYVDPSGDLIQLLLGSTSWSYIDLYTTNLVSSSSPQKAQTCN
jgi:hypothetical protein